MMSNYIHSISGGWKSLQLEQNLPLPVELASIFSPRRRALPWVAAVSNRTARVTNWC